MSFCGLIHICKCLQTLIQEKTTQVARQTLNQEKTTQVVRLSCKCEASNSKKGVEQVDRKPISNSNGATARNEESVERLQLNFDEEEIEKFNASEYRKISDTEDLRRVGTEVDVLEGSLHHIMQWSKDKIHMKTLEKTEAGRNDQFYLDLYHGLDTSDEHIEYFCTIRVYKQNMMLKKISRDLYLACTPEKKVALKAALFQPDATDFDNPDPKLFLLRCWSNITFFESAKHPGYYLAHNQEGHVYLKEVGTELTRLPVLEENVEIQFEVQKQKP